MDEDRAGQRSPFRKYLKIVTYAHRNHGPEDVPRKKKLIDKFAPRTPFLDVIYLLIYLQIGTISCYSPDG